MMKLPTKWARKERQNQIFVMTISAFLPSDDRKVWINQFILIKITVESGGRRIIPISFGVV
jgi:hypothetical protein